MTGALDVGAITFDVVRFSVDTGDIRDGDVDNGVPGSGGDALLLRDIGGLEDHNLDELSLEQAGIFVSRFGVSPSETPSGRGLRIEGPSRSVEILIPWTHTLILGNNRRLFPEEA